LVKPENVAASKRPLRPGYLVRQSVRLDDWKDLITALVAKTKNKSNAWLPAWMAAL
jgi:hypothetical protein